MWVGYRRVRLSTSHSAVHGDRWGRSGSFSCCQRSGLRASNRSSQLPLSDTHPRTRNKCPLVAGLSQSGGDRIETATGRDQGHQHSSECNCVRRCGGWRHLSVGLGLRGSCSADADACPAEVLVDVGGRRDRGGGSGMSRQPDGGVDDSQYSIAMPGSCRRMTTKVAVASALMSSYRCIS
jgi:hypothetical protein